MAKAAQFWNIPAHELEDMPLDWIELGIALLNAEMWAENKRAEKADKSPRR